MNEIAAEAALERLTVKEHPLLRALRRNVWWGVSIAALCGTLAILAAIFWFVLSRGLPALRPAVFVTVTSGTGGGLENAIIGTVMLVVAALIMVIIVGVGTGVWLAEYAQGNPRAFVRLLVDVLAGVPSIVVGYFGYVLLVKMLGWGFSLVGGSIALMIIMLPYVVRGTDLALEAVPRDLREGGFALGAAETVVLRTIAFPYALPGILTMLLLATGIALGETAPLIYTAGWSNYMPTAQLTHAPIAYLTYVIWTFINEPFAESHALAFAAAAILMLLIIITNVLLRSFFDGLASRQRGES
jgi:phosphate transport system permease protein